MKRNYLMAVAVLMIFCFVGTADAQRKKGSQGKRIQTMDIVITEVGDLQEPGGQRVKRIHQHSRQVFAALDPVDGPVPTQGGRVRKRRQEHLAPSHRIQVDYHLQG